jgi:hypothetical protein
MGVSYEIAPSARIWSPAAPVFGSAFGIAVFGPPDGVPYSNTIAEGDQIRPAQRDKYTARMRRKYAPRKRCK